MSAAVSAMTTSAARMLIQGMVQIRCAGGATVDLSSRGKQGTRLRGRIQDAACATAATQAFPSSLP